MSREEVQNDMSRQLNQDHNPLSSITSATWMAGPNSMILACVIAVMDRTTYNEYHRFMVTEVFPNGSTALLVEKVGGREWCYKQLHACRHFGAIPRDHNSLDKLVKALDQLPKTA